MIPAELCSPLGAIDNVFVANRGEIAVRIVCACRELGGRTVQAYSDTDRESLAVRLADQVVCVGGAPPKESYLNHPALIAAAKMCSADAVHPGYGFLSENGEFAEKCEAAGLAYIGPQPSRATRSSAASMLRIRSADFCRVQAC